MPQDAAYTMIGDCTPGCGPRRSAGLVIYQERFWPPAQHPTRSADLCAIPLRRVRRVSRMQALAAGWNIKISAAMIAARCTSRLAATAQIPNPPLPRRQLAIRLQRAR